MNRQRHVFKEFKSLGESPPRCRVATTTRSQRLTTVAKQSGMTAL